MTIFLGAVTVLLFGNAMVAFFRMFYLQGRSSF